MRYILAFFGIFLMIGCEITPYKRIFAPGEVSGFERVELQCARVGGVPVLCGVIAEKVVEVPVEVLVEVIIEKVVEVEKVVEIEKIIEVEAIVEIFTTEYVDREIDVGTLVKRVIAALPEGTTSEDYAYETVVLAVEETIETYVPEPQPGDPEPPETVPVAIPEGHHQHTFTHTHDGSRHSHTFTHPDGEADDWDRIHEGFHGQGTPGESTEYQAWVRAGKPTGQHAHTFAHTHDGTTHSHTIVHPDGELDDWDRIHDGQTGLH